METKFTKGEWKYRVDVIGNSFYIETVDQSHENTFIGEVGGGLQSKSEIESNAKLIAAAPEMLEALEHIIEYWNRDRNDQAMHNALWHIIETAEEAIKKATE